MSFACRTLLPPTAHALATWARVLPDDSAAVVVATGGCLTAYRIDASGSERRVDSAGILGEAIPAAQLRAVFTASIPGVVRSLHTLVLRGSAAAAAAGPGATRVDALLLTFDEGKISIVAFDPLTAALRTLAAVNLEHDAVGPGASQARAVRRATVQAGIAGTGRARLDPLGRVAALLVYDDQVGARGREGRGVGRFVVVVTRVFPPILQLAVLPLNGHGGLSAFEAASGGGASVVAESGLEYEEAAAEAGTQRLSAAILGGPPFIVDLAELRGAPAAGGAVATSSSGFAIVSDVAFLHGYGYAPALAVLEKRVLTSASRLGSAAHTTHLSVVAVDAAERRATFLWGRDGLPHDCSGLAPVPAPIGEGG